MAHQLCRSRQLAFRLPSPSAHSCSTEDMEKYRVWLDGGRRPAKPPLTSVCAVPLRPVALLRSSAGIGDGRNTGTRHTEGRQRRLQAQCRREQGVKKKDAARKGRLVRCGCFTLSEMTSTHLPVTSLRSWLVGCRKWRRMICDRPHSARILRCQEVTSLHPKSLAGP